MYSVMSIRIGSRASIRTGRSRYLSAKSPTLLSISSDLDRRAQFWVMCRSDFARRERSSGEYVSGSSGKVTMATNSEAIIVTFSILDVY